MKHNLLRNAEENEIDQTLKVCFIKAFEPN